MVLMRRNFRLKWELQRSLGGVTGTSSQGPKESFALSESTNGGGGGFEGAGNFRPAIHEGWRSQRRNCSLLALSGSRRRGRRRGGRATAQICLGQQEIEFPVQESGCCQCLPGRRRQNGMRDRSNGTGAFENTTDGLM